MCLIIAEKKGFRYWEAFTAFILNMFFKIYSTILELVT
jgi:hypothetical protein